LASPAIDRRHKNCQRHRGRNPQEAGPRSQRFVRRTTRFARLRLWYRTPSWSMLDRCQTATQSRCRPRFRPRPIIPNIAMSPRSLPTHCCEQAGSEGGDDEPAMSRARNRKHAAVQRR
jgi:hypothetical protein